MRDGIKLSESIAGGGAAIFRHACWMDLEGIVSKRIGSRYIERTRMAENEESEFRGGDECRLGRRPDQYLRWMQILLAAPSQSAGL
jgi:hypothetical protein